MRFDAHTTTGRYPDGKRVWFYWYRKGWYVHVEVFRFALNISPRHKPQRKLAA